MVPLVIAAVALLLAAAAWARARRVARKLDTLAQSYWELRYDFTRLRSQVARLDPETAAVEAPPQEPPPGQLAFVPLASIKKKG
jgi:hypothetical protein